MTKILVIEDERYLLEDITELLQYTDFEVQGANNGTLGVQIAESYLPDLIICDIMMPELDGYQVLEQIRSNPETANTSFIFLTAKADRDSVRQGMELGADDYLTKPFTSAELLTAINSRLTRQNQIAVHSEQKIEGIKRQLTRMVTHELRTPLISINTVVDVISRQIGQLSQSEMEELLDSISAGSKRLSHRVEQLVFITQLESGMLNREVIMREGLPMRLWEMLVAANNLARRFSYQQQPNVNVQFHDHDRDALVMCNPAALKQALGELIANAVTFSPENSQVNISQWRSGGKVLISIVDQGPGMPEERLAEALRAFSQLDRETTEQQGMGLGLALAQRIIEAHGGKLEILSVVDKGTQVTLTLPIVAG
ncbi:MAG: response regulator [Chloroflexota bacterium]